MLNIKNIKLDDLPRIFLGLVFLSAGIYRVFNWQEAVLEILNLNLPFAEFISLFVMALEIIGGTLLMLNFKTKKIALIFSLFIVLALAFALFSSWQAIINDAGKLFTFQAESTDFFLHLTYLLILLFIAKK